MRYIVIDDVGVDFFAQEFNTKKEAIDYAEYEWSCMSEYDKKRRDAYFVIESINPDVEAPDHYDGTLIWDHEFVISKNVRKGKSVKFEHDGIEFLIVVTGNYCECYAACQFQFGFKLGQNGYTEDMDDLIELLIINYENGIIIIEE